MAPVSRALQRFRAKNRAKAKATARAAFGPKAPKGFHFRVHPTEPKTYIKVKNPTRKSKRQ